MRTLPRLALLSLGVLVLLSGCCKKIATPSYIHTSDSTIVIIRDTTIILSPNTAEYTEEMDISTIIHNASTVNHQPSTVNHQPSTVNHKPSTDTLWVYGTYADAYAFISNNKLRLRLQEGKEFKITLSKAIREREHWREKYTKIVEEHEKPTFLAQLKPILTILLIIIIAIIFLKLISR